MANNNWSNFSLHKLGMDKSFPLSGWSSLAVHGGHTKDPMYAHQVPVYASSTYVYDSAEQGMRRFSGEEPGFIYSRWGNPTLNEAEEKISALETFGLGIETRGILHASGMAAITTLMLSNLVPGDKILTHFSLYGGTNELVNNVLPAIGITPIIADLRDLNKAESIIRSEPSIKMMYLETPANPTIQCVDIDELSKLAHTCSNLFNSM
jgi:methionine-gamma-lyase